MVDFQVSKTQGDARSRYCEQQGRFQATYKDDGSYQADAHWDRGNESQSQVQADIDAKEDSWCANFVLDK